MIVDKLGNSGNYQFPGDRFAMAFGFLQNTDLVNASEGRHEIDGDDVYAIISNYDTKSPSGTNPEAHRIYADVQYMVSGSELIGYTVFSGQIVYQEYNAEKDFMLYNDVSFYIKMDTGMFAVFYPGDIHMPGIMEDKPQPVRKVVVKVKL